MLKLLLFFLFLGLAWWWLRRPSGDRRDSLPAERPEESIVACAHCGVHVPESQAIVLNGRFYCSPQHCPGAGLPRE